MRSVKIWVRFGCIPGCLRRHTPSGEPEVWSLPFTIQVTSRCIQRTMRMCNIAQPVPFSIARMWNQSQSPPWIDAQREPKNQNPDGGDSGPDPSKAHRAGKIAPESMLAMIMQTRKQARQNSLAVFCAMFFSTPSINVP